jgi:hypothetical protein
LTPTGTITRVAGNGTHGNGGDDGLATDAQLQCPWALALTFDDGFLIADAGSHVVRRVSAGGAITRVAGSGKLGNRGDDGLATVGKLSCPLGLALGLDGGFLIADCHNHEIRRVSPGGVITRVAGRGAQGNTGDDGPATVGQLAYPVGLAVTTDGDLLIADSNNHEIRRVSASAVITRAAGTGASGHSGDGGPATTAELHFPLAVAALPDGGFLIADTANHVIRRVSASGVISRVAGNGTQGASGDDGPATDAQLSWPLGLAVLADGGFLIADTGNHMVRKVSAQGIISRVAGTGKAGDTGDDGTATDARLAYPTDVAVLRDGGFLIADPVSGVVRKVWGTLG